MLERLKETLTVKKVILILILFGAMLVNGMLNGLRGLSLPLIKEEFGTGYDMQGLLLLITTAVGTVSTFAANLIFQRDGTRSATIVRAYILSGNGL